MCRNAARSSAKMLRLFPGGEVAAVFGFVEVDQVVVGLLGPAPRRVDVLVRKTVTAAGKDTLAVA